MSDPNATPPVPPVAPAPPVPPVPQYGEYAPDGYVAPQPVAPQLDATAAEPFGAVSYGQQPPAKTRKTWDLVLTSILLVLGLFGMLAGVIYGYVFTDQDLLDQAMQDGGLAGFSGDVGAIPAVLVISHVVLYLLALGAGIPLLLKRKIAFWAPLTAGVIAAVFFWGSIFAVVLSDPGLTTQLT